jgi:hypothetical protein
MDPDDQRRVAAISAAAGRLRVDYAAARAIRAFESAGIPCVVLKGPSIARWLFEPEDARTYVDCDLLVHPAEFDIAVRLLTGIGFHPDLDEAQMPSWWREHALTAFHTDDGTMVDLHRSLPGAEVEDERQWSTLSGSTDEIKLGDLTVRALSQPGRLMHAALHAAQHGGTGRDLEVLERGIVQIGIDIWRAAADLAASLEAVPAFAQGLALLPAGVVLADRLGLDPPPAIDVELRAAGAAEALTFSRLHRTRGLRARAELVRHKLFPPATFMRKWSPLARRGRLGLVAAYLYRPVWVARRAPSALRAWREARDTVRRHADANSSPKTPNP